MAHDYDVEEQITLPTGALVSTSYAPHASAPHAQPARTKRLASRSRRTARIGHACRRDRPGEVSGRLPTPPMRAVPVRVERGASPPVSKTVRSSRNRASTARSSWTQHLPRLAGPTLSPPSGIRSWLRNRQVPCDWREPLARGFRAIGSLPRSRSGRRPLSRTMRRRGVVTPNTIQEETHPCRVILAKRRTRNIAFEIRAAGRKTTRLITGRHER